MLITFFADDVTEALQYNDLFPKDENFELASCQQWTRDVRSFPLKDYEKAKSVPVLMYHRIIDEKDLDENLYEEDGSIVSTVVLKENFTEQMKLLKREEYTTLTLRELELFINGKLDVPKNSIVLTFDDGFKDNAYEAYPVLKENDFTAASFVITGSITKNEKDYKPGTFQYLSVHDLKNSCDVFEFESHTYNFHQRMKDGTPFLIGKTDKDAEADIRASIVNLDGSKQAFASPYGGFDDGNIQLFKDLGFNMAFTVVPGDVSRGTNIYEIPRKEIKPETTIEEYKQIIGLQ